MILLRSFADSDFNRLIHRATDEEMLALRSAFRDRGKWQMLTTFKLPLFLKQR